MTVLGEYLREITVAPYSTLCTLELAACPQLCYYPLFCDSSGSDL